MRSTSLGVLRFQLFSSQVDFWPTSVLQSKYRVYPTVVTCAGADRKRKAVFDEKRLCVEVSCQQTQQIHASSTVAARLDRRLTKFALPGLSQLDNRRDFSNEIEDFVRSFVSFTRPHTILGTLISVVSMSLMASSLESLSYLPFTKHVWQAVLCALTMNVAIVGLNQVYDKKIDKINKPYLPLACGKFTTNTALTIVASTCSISLIFGAISSSFYLMITLVLSLMLGIVYSSDIMLFRWKRLPLLAVFCILSVRAVLVQWGFFGHFASSLSYIGYCTVPSRLCFSVLFMGIYSIVIALLKDTPDVVGDSKSGIETFTVRVGVVPVLNLCMLLLFLDYMSGVYVGLVHSSSQIQLCVLAGGHLLCLSLIFVKYLQTTTASSSSLYSFYMFIWKMFYVEYMMFPFL